MVDVYGAWDDDGGKNGQGYCEAMYNYVYAPTDDHNIARMADGVW